MLPQPGGTFSGRRLVIILAAGRSGSTLVQSAFLSNCNALTFFEPCRHSPLGDVREDQCVDQVMRYLLCDLPQQNRTWNPPHVHRWFRHPYVGTDFGCRLPPFQSVSRTTEVCKRASVVLVKEIRLVGQMHRLTRALQHRITLKNQISPAVIHLVRDPRSVIASQLRLRWHGFVDALSHRQRLEIVQMTARRICDGMVADATTGDQLQRAGQLQYMLVRFEELSSDLERVVYRLHDQLRMAIPSTTRLWLERMLSGDCNQGMNSSDANKDSGLNDAFEYGTCRGKFILRRVRNTNRWKHFLHAAERKSLENLCANALARFGYD